MDFVTILCLATVAAWGWLMVVLYSAHKDRLHFSIIFSLLYLLTYPIKLIGTQNGYGILDSSRFGAEAQVLALVISAICALAFLLPSMFPSSRPSLQVSSLVNPRLGSPGLWFFLFIVCLLLAFPTRYFFNLFSFAGLRSLIYERAGDREGRALYAVAMEMAMVCLLINVRIVVATWSSFTPAKKASVVGSWLFISYCFLGLTGSKVLALMPYAAAFLFSHVQRLLLGRQRSFIYYVNCLLLGVLGVLFTGFARNFGSFQAASASDMFYVSFLQLVFSFDAIDNLTAVLYRTKDMFFGDLGFAPTLQYLFVAFIPRALWPDKPIIYGNLLIMQKYIPERYSGFQGEVVSPSMAGEMIVSGGSVFMLFWSIAIGGLFLYLYKKLWRSKVNSIWFEFHMIAYVWVLLNVFNLLRSGTGMVGGFLYFSAFLLAALLAKNV